MKCRTRSIAFLLAFIAGCAGKSDVDVKSGTTKDQTQEKTVVAKEKEAAKETPRVEINTGMKNGISSVAVTPDGKYAAVHGQGQTKNLQVWDLEKKEKIGEFDNQNGGKNDIAISSDGKTLFYEHIPGSTGMVNVLTKEIKYLPLEGDHLYCSPKGDTAVTVGYGKVFVWELPSGKKISTWETDKDNLSVTVLWEGKKFATVNQEDGKVKIWELDTGKLVQTLEGHGKRSFASPKVFSPDGKWLVTSASINPLTIWDTKTGKTFKKIELQLRADIALFMPDNKTLVYPQSIGEVERSQQFDIVMENLETGVKRVLAGHKGHIWGMAMTPDGKTLVSGGVWDGGMLKIWNLQTP